MTPLQNQRPQFSQPSRPGSVGHLQSRRERLVVNEDVVDRDPTWRIEGKLEHIGQHNALLQQRIHLLLLNAQMLKRSLEQIVRTEHPTDISNVRLKQADTQTRTRSYAIPRLRKINRRHKVQDLIDNIDLLHDDGGIKRINSGGAPAIARVTKAVVDGLEVVVGEGVGVVAAPGEAEHFDNRFGATCLVLIEPRVVVVAAFLTGVGHIGIGRDIACAE
jgi:hypothetical protein